ncbi:hypothetical protein [Klebsiella variicola]|uniref:hypothetical protein n=1 Tax=Klebsiella variicola TaxID=244366 RepID=UPI002F927135
MTKSTITRERLEEIVSDPMINQGSEFAMMARMALAAMDSEQVEMPLDYLQGHKDGLEWAAQLAESNHPETGDWLYDDPIELAKAIRKGPDMPPAQPAADSEPVAIIDQANLDYLRSGADADVWPPEREEMGDVLLYRHAQPVLEIESEPVFTLEVARAYYKGQKLGNHFGFITLDAARELKEGNYQLYTAQPAPVVPEEATPDSIEILASARRRDHAVFQWDEDQRNAAADSWNACRAAMLQELQKSAGAEVICRSNENVQVLNTIKATPTLGSFPKTGEVQNTNPPENPGCWCRTCRPVVLNDMRFVVCPDCGNKRCPRANDHRNACTGSNEPGQEGSAYPVAPQEVKGE